MPAAHTCGSRYSSIGQCSPGTFLQEERCFHIPALPYSAGRIKERGCWVLSAQSRAQYTGGSTVLTTLLALSSLLGSCNLEASCGAPQEGAGLSLSVGLAPSPTTGPTELQQY